MTYGQVNPIDNYRSLWILSFRSPTGLTLSLSSFAFWDFQIETNQLVNFGFPFNVKHLDSGR